METLRRIVGFAVAAVAAALVAGFVRVSVGLLTGTDDPKFDLWSDMMWAPPALAGIELPMTAIAFAIALVLSASLSVFFKNLPQPWILAGAFSAVSMAVIASRSSDPWSGTMPFSIFDAYAQSWSDGSVRRLIVIISMITAGVAAAMIWMWFTRRTAKA